MPHIDVDGLKIYYEWHGEGPPLVLIAGYACDTSLWGGVLDTLSKHYRVLIFDNRGAGRTDAPEEPYTIETMADDVLKLTNALGVERFALLGHSMGGCTAQYVAYKFPDRVSNLILANTSASFGSGISMTFRFFYRLRVLGTPMELMLRGIMPWLYSDAFLSSCQSVEAVVKETESDPYPQTLIGQHGQIEALLGFNSTGWCASISVPTLIIAGDKDLASPPTEAEYLAAQIAGSELVVIPNMAHLPLVENPKLFTDLVMNFLSR